MTSETLRPCPFCGGSSGVVVSNDAGHYVIRCNNRDCEAEGPWTEPDATEATNLWNTRIQPDSVESMRARIATLTAERDAARAELAKAKRLLRDYFNARYLDAECSMGEWTTDDVVAFARAEVQRERERVVDAIWSANRGKYDDGTLASIISRAVEYMKEAT